MKTSLLSLRLCLALAAWGLLAVAAEARQGTQTSQRKGTDVELDGLHSKAPADWVEEPTRSQFRLKQFRLSAVGDDKDNAEIVVFTFGAQGGGSVADNIKRWKGMFVPPEGKQIDDVAKVEEFKVGDVKVTQLDVRGTYLYKARPFDPNAETIRKPNYRMIGVIFATKNEPYYIRFVGPEETVKHYRKGFTEWLKGFK